MNYWLDLFTGTTWEEFQQAGAKVTGFREHNWKRAQKICPGDIFLCYLVGVKRWVGLLQVTGARYRDQTPIWGEEVFPVRFPVRPIVMLRAEHGVPMEDFRGRLSFYPADMVNAKWSGWVRSSPTQYAVEDGEAVSAAVRAAEQQKQERALDQRMLRRSANLYKMKKRKAGEPDRIVAIPTKEQEEKDSAITPSDTATHTAIQWRLLDLGAQMGLNVWAPRADRGKQWNGRSIADVANMLATLPTQFDEVTNRTIENIDVLWLKGNAIVAAFEVEHTTSIYSGLLRMSDLLTMQPNIDIKLYLAAPDERFAKFQSEVPRPTFASREKPLHELCGFLPYSKLTARLEEVRNVVAYLRPEFIDEVAEFYDPAEEFDA